MTREVAIVRRKGVMSGVPCVEGTRVPARSIAALFKRGLSREAIVVFYGVPGIDLEAVDAALRYVMKGRPLR